MSSNKPKSYSQLFWNKAGPALIILILVIAAEIGAFAYGRLANKFNREGVVATGIVTAVEQYEALEIEAFYEDLRNNYDDGDIITVISYEYRDKAGNLYTDENLSRNLAIEKIPKVGSGFEMRYLASDPETHEARIGHIDSNVAALHWIATFFGALTLGYVIWGAFAARKKFNSTTERRKRRQAELENRPT